MAFKPQYRITPHLLRTIERISVMKGRIDASIVSVEWAPRLTKEAFARMTRASTGIEGNPLTLPEVVALSEGRPVKATKYVQEATNYLAALQYIASKSKQKALGSKDILKLHGIIGAVNALDREPAGAFRTYQVYVGSYVPPQAKHVAAMVNDMFIWLHEHGDNLPAVITSAILHFQTVQIHPFGDGNGRAARLLATWELFRKDFDTKHIFSVDEVFWNNRPRYYDALDLVRTNRLDMTSWLEFVAEAVDLTLEGALQRLATLPRHAAGPEIVLTDKQARLLEILTTQALSIREVQEMLKVTKAGAHYILTPLLEKGFIQRVGGHKTGRYTLKAD